LYVLELQSQKLDLGLEILKFNSLESFSTHFPT